MIFEHTHYPSFLKAVLAERVASNPSYSMRAFARDLKVHPAQLSAIFKGRKGLSMESAMRVAQALGFGPKETEYFCLLVQYETAPSEELKDVLGARMRGLNPAKPARELSVDLFKAIADWYHLPILEMTQLKGGDFSPRGIASRLGITPLEAEAAIERLERLELIEGDGRGGYRKVRSNLLIQTRHSSRALQGFYKQMLRKAALCFDDQEPSERYFATQVFAIDPSQLDQAREIVDRFTDEMVALFDRSKKLSEIYQLGVQLFRLTSKERRPAVPETRKPRPPRKNQGVNA